MNEKELFTQKKQQFLRTEIIDQKYDPGLFASYLQRLKENGADINEWTLVDLEKIVRKFKAEPKAFFSRTPSDYSGRFVVFEDFGLDFKMAIQGSTQVLHRSIQNLRKLLLYL